MPIVNRGSNDIKPLYFDNSKFNIVKEEKHGFWESILSILGFNTTHRLNIVTKEDRGASIAIRTEAPSILSRKWVELKIGANQRVYVNVNSLAYRLNVSSEEITHTESLEGFLDERTKPISRLQAPHVPKGTEFPSAIALKIPRFDPSMTKEFSSEQLKNFSRLASVANETIARESAEIGEKAIFLTQITLINEVSYVEANQPLLDRLLAEAKEKNPLTDHIVLSKRDTGLVHSIEYRGPGKIYIRFNAGFAFGSSKIVSKALNPYTNEIITKGKMIVSLGESSDEETLKLANLYKSAMSQKHNEDREAYKSKPTTVEKAMEEAYVGQNIPGILKTLHFSAYTKEAKDEQGNVIARVHKIGIYTLFQPGSIASNLPRQASRQNQAALGIVENIANMHRENLVNNDIKGQNILWIIDENNFIRTSIIDLGYAKSANDVSKYFASTFLPPEVLVSNFSIDIDNFSEDKKILYAKAKDGYALGMTLLTDVYGVEVPWDRGPRYFVDKNPAEKRQREALIKQMQDPESLKLPERIPPEMRHVIMGLLNPNPEKRMTPVEAEAYLLKYYAEYPDKHPRKRPQAAMR